MAAHLWSGGAWRSMMERAGDAAPAEIGRARRIVVMGAPGSGKSTMARCLGARLGLPVFHLDQVWWRPGWVQAPAEEFAAEVERLVALPAWVIDGNYTATLAPRFRTADTVVYLDIPSWLSMMRVVVRMVRGYGRVRPDMPAGCAERIDFAFLVFTWRWNRERRVRNLGVVEEFGGRKVVLRGPGAVRRFLGG
jgi:adenylate kinase family enzyme